ncbi:MAG TPA: hypothetical protein VGP88_05820, partial [Thermoplasmata archaeon]|nr:hypothetical protein [Thermoplasmata archaeon]
MTREPLPTRFDPATVEARWQAEWRKHEVAKAPSKPTGRTFSLILPPPNVTAFLTIGHMMGDTCMDVL